MHPKYKKPLKARRIVSNELDITIEKYHIRVHKKRNPIRKWLKYKKKNKPKWRRDEKKLYWFYKKLHKKLNPKKYLR